MTRSPFFASALALWSLSAGAATLPSFSAVKARYATSEGRLLDRNGNLLQEVRLRWRGRTLAWAPLKEISPALLSAAIDVEDRRFREHGGVDFRALAGALVQDLGGGKRGASTITMQAVSLLDEAGMPRGGKRGIWEKIRQARLAWELERTWTKDQILETYLNLASFRGEYRGVTAAARALFGKDPHGLDLRESRLLVTLLRSPGMSSDTAGALLCAQAVALPALGDCPSLRVFAFSTLSQLRPPAPRAQLAPHLARRLLAKDSASEVRSSVRLDAQLAALAAVQDQLSQLKAQNVRDAAVIVADNRTGEVLAYVGGAGGISTSPDVDMGEARRQAGSTLKPFLYGLAFNKNYLTPDSWILDEPLEIGLDRGSYEPDNYDHIFHGPVPAKVALASSLNIPAVRVVGLVGVDDFQRLLDTLGFRSLEEGDHYGPSLALGTADVTLRDLTQAYMALANGGLWKPLRFTPGGALPARRVLSAAAASEVAAILADRGFRSLTFGWDSLLATPYPAAVKTGTSKDMRDNWCVGFTRAYTVGVWVGNSGGEPMWAVSGVSGAAPVWRAVMDHLQKHEAALPLPRLASRESRLDRGQFGRILYPTNGAVLAVDPDIPPAHQRVLLETDGEGSLLLDGEPLVDLLWKPVPGHHSLRLTSASGATLDELHFEVR